MNYGRSHFKLIEDVMSYLGVPCCPSREIILQNLSIASTLSIFKPSSTQSFFTMLVGKASLRRVRNRRVLSKAFTRTGSHPQNESGSNESFQMPIYVFVLLSFTLWYYVGTMKTFSIFFAVLVARRLGIFKTLKATFQAYKVRKPHHGPTFRDKCLYYVDYWLSTNSYAKALVLVGLTWFLILSSGTLISWMANEPWDESLWGAALGSGLDWSFINSTTPSLRLVAVCTNVGGLVLTALLLSLISDAVQTKYDSLRKGESPVTEQGHTLIIGWSVKSLSVMKQLAMAGESVGGQVIVCLSDQREKEDMENDIAHADFNFANVGARVVCRSGSPLSYNDLKRVSFYRARSIIILGDDELDVETNDARSLQILLSIVASLEREKAALKKSFRNHGAKSNDDEIVMPSPDRIVIEVMDTENAAIMTSVSPELVEPVLAHDVVGRLMLQAARNPLVADVWQDLLGFDGCETYSGQWGILRGLTFKEVLLCFEDAIPLGVKTSSGELFLNPSDSYVIGEGDEIIVLAEDDDTYCASITHSLIREKVPDRNSPSGYRYVDICPGGLEAIRNFSHTWAHNPSLSLSRYESRDIANQDTERILFCGWRFDMGNLLQVFSAVAPIGSEFWILDELPIEQRENELRLRGWECNSRVRVVHHVGACRRNVLAQLPLESFSSVIVGTSDSSGNSKHKRFNGLSEHSSQGKTEAAGEADARVITVVMMIQDITTRRNPDKATESGNSHGRNSSLRRRDKGLGYSSLSEDQRSSSSYMRNLGANGRATSTGLSRARSQRFLGSKNTRECNTHRGVIVGEIIDSRSRAMLSMVNSIDAVVASSELISKAVAMVSEDGSVNKVLNTLFDPYDSEITLETVDTYVDLTSCERVSFFELMARGRDVGTIVLGYLVREVIQSEDNEEGTIRYTDVALNPSDKDLRRGWHPDDLLIVLTPGTSDSSSVAPSDFLTDICEVQAMDMSRDFPWTDETITSVERRHRVRFTTTNT